MSDLFLNEIIRYKKDEFTTPNIIDVDDKGNLEIFCENFRRHQKDTELFLFFYFENCYYLPLWFEFRSINNNLLYLLEEYQISSFDLLQKILNSSLIKEEHWRVRMKAIVYHPRKKPPFSHKLTDFNVEKEFRIDIYE
ncbi:MAG: hypothetical protein JNM24_15510 [Bdellovibrionaceae bacterium]|jgi:hypothetical protein|nr:hypothetical protein [Pseudobdellovibrionaceae bacterium]